MSAMSLLALALLPVLFVVHKIGCRMRRIRLHDRVWKRGVIRGVF